MVRILPNGDIVQDDDPRNNQSSSSGNPQQPQPTPRRGVVQHDAQDVHHHMPQGASIFDTLDQRLRQAGVPRWNLGPYPVEPIVSLGFLLALLLLGLKGIILALLLFFVSKWSQGSAQGTAGGQGQGFQGWQGRGLGGFLGANQQGGGGGGGTSGSSGGASGHTQGRDSNTRGSGSSGHSWSGTGQKLGR